MPSIEELLPTSKPFESRKAPPGCTLISPAAKLDRKSVRVSVARRMPPSQLKVAVPSPARRRAVVSMPWLPAVPSSCSVPLDPAKLPRMVDADETCPPAPTVSEAVSRSPITSTPLFAHADPAPVTLTMPSLPTWPAMIDVPMLVTMPPLEIVSEPEPLLPTYSAPLFAHDEPAPVTLAVPSLPTWLAMIDVPPLVTVPPAEMVSDPVPLLPTYSSPLFAHDEPAPVTLAVPVLPAWSPMREIPTLVTVPPLETVSEPVPKFPT